MPEYFIWMSIIGVAVIVKGLLSGYCVDWFLAWVGLPDRSKQQMIIKRQNKSSEATGDNVSS
jgi:hypothetical protein